MKEIEILIKVNEDLEQLLNKLKDFQFIKKDKIQDIYYYDPKRKNLKPDNEMKLKECFRVRSKKDKCYLTYKKDNFKGEKWIYSDEWETYVEDRETLLNIIKNIGFKKLVEIDNERYTYQYQDYEIILENVKELGVFLEIEYKNKVNDDKDIEHIKEKIREIINSISIKEYYELNAGKPELMLKKIYKKSIV